MEARFLILARYAEQAADGSLNLVGGDNLHVASDHYPAIHPLLTAAAKLRFSKSDEAKPRSFRTVLVAKDTGEVIAEGTSGTIPPIVIPPELDTLSVGLILKVSSILFPRPGVYELKVYIDEVEVDATTLRVDTPETLHRLTQGIREASTKALQAMSKQQTESSRAEEPDGTE